MSSVPNQPKTPGYSVRLAPDLRRTIEAIAREDGLTASDIIRLALAAYAESRGY